MTDRSLPIQMPALPPLEQNAGASQDPGPGDLGIVMGGGGARAAYQIGFLRCAARLFPNLRIPYVTGVSAGAINAALLASTPRHFHPGSRGADPTVGQPHGRRRVPHRYALADREPVALGDSTHFWR